MLALTHGAAGKERTPMLKGRSYMYKPPGVLYLNLRLAPSVNRRDMGGGAGCGSGGGGV